MQGILKSNHERLCSCMKEAKEMHTAEVGLQQHEHELQSLFSSYQEKMKEIKRLILAYEEKERIIKNEIRRIKKQNPLAESKKPVTLVATKNIVLLFTVLQAGCMKIISEAEFAAFLCL